MITQGYTLKTDADFLNAILFGLIVSITWKGAFVGTSQIISQSYHVVQTMDAYYFKHACTFTVCSAIQASS